MKLSRRDIARLGALSSGVFLLGCATAQSNSGSNAPGASDPASETEVATAVETFRKAMVDADGATLWSLAEADLSFGHSNGLIQTRSQFVNSVVTKKEDFKSLQLTNPTTTVVGNVAIRRHRFISDIILDGKDLSVNLAVLEVWRRRDRWRLLVRQAFNA